MTAIQETKVELLREKNIKPLAYSNKATGYELRDFTVEMEQVTSNDLKHLKRAYMDDLDEPAIGSLSVGDKPEAPPSTEYLIEQHCKDTNTIDFLRHELKESERKRKMEAESSDTWRNKYIAADNELTKAKVKHDAEVRNLQYEITLLNKALEAHAGDEQLLLLTMKKAVSFAERVVEG